jgi:anti-anti-sigma factor
MEIQHIDIGDVRKVILVGRMDSSGVDRIEVRFQGVIVPAGRHTVVDLTGVPFMASLGVRLLISTTRALSRSGRRLALFGVSSEVMDIIETMGIQDIIPVTDSEAAAIALVTA